MPVALPWAVVRCSPLSLADSLSLAASRCVDCVSVSLSGTSRCHLNRGHTKCRSKFISNVGQRSICIFIISFHGKTNHEDRPRPTCSLMLVNIDRLKKKLHHTIIEFATKIVIKVGTVKRGEIDGI